MKMKLKLKAQPRAQSQKTEGKNFYFNPVLSSAAFGETF